MKGGHAYGFVLVVVLSILALLVLSAPSVHAAAAERAKVDLMPTGVIPDAAGDASLALRINNEGQIQFQATARARGLIQNAVFSLCVDDVFVDSDDASVRGRVTLSENPDVRFTSLSGLTVTIETGIGCAGTVVLTGTVP